LIVKGKIDDTLEKPTKGKDKQYVYFVVGKPFSCFTDLKLKKGEDVEIDYNVTQFGSEINHVLVAGEKRLAKKSTSKAPVEPQKPQISQVGGSTYLSRHDALDLAVKVLRGSEMGQDTEELIDFADELEEYLLKGKKEK